MDGEATGGGSSGMAVTVQTRSSTIRLPPGVSTLAGFRRWAGSDSVPEHAAAWFVKGNVWVDCRPQQLFAEADIRLAVVC